MEGEAQLWRPAERRSLWDSTPLPPDDDGDDDVRQLSSSSSDAAHALSETPPLSPRPVPPGGPPADDAPAQSPAQAPTGQAMPLPGPVSVPELAQGSEGTAAADGGAKIPYDWAISIDDAGRASVESGSGRVAVGSGEERGQPDEAPEGSAASTMGSSSGPSEPGAPDGARRLGKSPGPGASVLKLSRTLDVKQALLRHLDCPLDPVCRFTRRLLSLQSCKCAGAGSLRGGQAVVDGQMAEAIAAMRNAKALLGQGPKLHGIQAHSINSGLVLVTPPGCDCHAALSQSKCFWC